MEKVRITGVVLAGGKSSRMGTDKALLEYKGKPLICHAAGILDSFCEKVVISSSHNRYAFTGYEIWPDEIAVSAAISGIYTCLRRSATRYIFVLSTDMPMADTGFLRSMADECGNYDLILPVHDGHVEPLCGIYSKDLLGVMEQNIRSEQYGLQRLPEKCNAKLIPAGQLHLMFFNVNTREDFDLLNKS